MKTYLAIMLVVLVGIGVFFVVVGLHITERFNAATAALEKASNDYRDAAQNYEAERQRIGQELSQLAKDRVQIRAYMQTQKKGG